MLTRELDPGGSAVPLGLSLWKWMGCGKVGRGLVRWRYEVDQMFEM